MSVRVIRRAWRVAGVAFLLLGMVVAFTSNSVRAEGESAPNLDLSTGGLPAVALDAPVVALEEVAAVTSQETAALSEPERDAVRKYLRDNPMPSWAAPAVKRWATENAEALVAAESTPDTPLTWEELRTNAMADLRALSGPQQGGAAARLAGAAALAEGEGAADSWRSPSGKFLIRPRSVENLVRREASGAASAMAATGGADAEIFLPLRVRTIENNDPESFDCGTMVGQGYLSLALFTQPTEHLEVSVHLEHGVGNLGALLLVSEESGEGEGEGEGGSGPNYLWLPASGSPFDYTFTESELEALNGEVVFILLNDDEEPETLWDILDNIVAWGKPWNLDSSVTGTATLVSPEDEELSRAVNFTLDPDSVDLVISAAGLELESEDPSAFKIFGAEATSLSLPDPNPLFFFHLATKAEVATLWGPGGFGQVSLEYPAPIGNLVGEAIFTVGEGEGEGEGGSQPAQDQVLSIPFRLTGDGAGTPLTDVIEGGFLLLNRAEGTGLSFHMDLSGISDATTVRLLNVDGITVFERPVIGPRFDYIINSCEMSTLVDVNSVVLTTTAYPNGAYGGFPALYSDEQIEPYRPGCDVEWTLTIENNDEANVSALGLVVQIPYGWTLEAHSAQEGTPLATASLPSFRPTVGSEGRLEYSWVSPPAFPYALTLRLQTTGDPYDTDADPHYLAYQILHRESGPLQLNPSYLVEFQPDILGVEGEGEEPCVELLEESSSTRSIARGDTSPVDFIEEGPSEGEGVSVTCDYHSSDYDDGGDFRISLSELLSSIQLYNTRLLASNITGEYFCWSGDTDDGYTADPLESTDHSCSPHDLDYKPQDWRIALSELLRVIQFYNAGGYLLGGGTEDGFWAMDGSLYRPGESMRIELRLDATDAPWDIGLESEIAAVGFMIELPAGWTYECIPDHPEPGKETHSYVCAETDIAQEGFPRLRPSIGDENRLGFAYLYMPEELSTGDNVLGAVVNVKSPEVPSGIQYIEVYGIMRLESGAYLKTTSDSLSVQSIGLECAETNPNIVTSVHFAESELSTFTPETALRGPEWDGTCPIARFHSADTNFDWMISIGELNAFDDIVDAEAYGCDGNGGYIPNGTNEGDCDPLNIDLNSDWDVSEEEYAATSAIMIDILLAGGKYHTNPINETEFLPGDSICNGLRSLEYFHPDGQHDANDQQHYFGTAVSGEASDWPDDGVGYGYFYNSGTSGDQNEDDLLGIGHFRSYNPNAVMDPTAEFTMNPVCDDSEYCEILVRESNTLIPGNTGNWSHIRPDGLFKPLVSGQPLEEQRHSMEGMDELVFFASQRDQKVLLQHIFWYQELPRDFAGIVSDTLKIISIEDHIDKVAEWQEAYWGDVVRGWSVVNEYLGDHRGNSSTLPNVTTTSYNDAYSRRPAVDDYPQLTYAMVEAAFVKARQEMPDMYLYYNDYSCESTVASDVNVVTYTPPTSGGGPRGVRYSQKSAAQYLLLKELLEHELIEGRPIVDGVGMQCHLRAWQFRPCTMREDNENIDKCSCQSFSGSWANCDTIDLDEVLPWFEPWLDGLETNVLRLKALGLQVEITELDIDISNPDNYSWCSLRNGSNVDEIPEWWRDLDLEARECIQGKMFERIFSVARSLDMNVAVWDLPDKYSWIGYYYYKTLWPESEGEGEGEGGVEPRHECAICGDESVDFGLIPRDSYNDQSVNATLYDDNLQRKVGAYFNGVLKAFRPEGGL